MKFALNFRRGIFVPSGVKALLKSHVTLLRLSGRRRCRKCDWWASKRSVSTLLTMKNWFFRSYDLFAFFAFFVFLFASRLWKILFCFVRIVRSVHIVHIVHIAHVK